ATNSSSEQPTASTCTTFFIDDYRYESDRVQTNLVDWYATIALLRGGTQAYVWVRLLLLVHGAYVVAVAGKRTSDSLLTTTMFILVKIPFEVVVYSSLLPVSGYVIALLLDSSVMNIFLDSFWAAVGGAQSTLDDLQLRKISLCNKRRSACRHRAAYTHCWL
ncbi:hypothetical protein PF006_g30923, partial [Phytophthora fragariae]